MISEQPVLSWQECEQLNCNWTKSRSCFTNMNRCKCRRWAAPGENHSRAVELWCYSRGAKIGCSFSKCTHKDHANERQRRYHFIQMHHNTSTEPQTGYTDAKQQNFHNLFLILGLEDFSTASPKHGPVQGRCCEEQWCKNKSRIILIMVIFSIDHFQAF